jgi:hypothetical protein
MRFEMNTIELGRLALLLLVAVFVMVMATARAV